MVGKKKVSKKKITKVEPKVNIIEFIGLRAGENLVLPSDRIIFDSWYQDGNVFFLVGNKAPEPEIEVKV